MFHCMFPANCDRASTWATCIGRNDWKPWKNARICSHHFKECDIDRASDKVKIKGDAFPSRKERVKDSHLMDHDYLSPPPGTLSL